MNEHSLTKPGRISLVSTQSLAWVKVRATTPCYGLFCAEKLSIETIAALQAFRKRHADAQRIQSQLSTQPTTVDIAHYRSILKNKAIVDEAEKLLKDFRPVSYDVAAHVKAIEVFEAKAVCHPVHPEVKFTLNSRLVRPSVFRIGG